MVSKNAPSAVAEPFGMHDHPSWQHPYRNARIYFHRDVVRALSSQALRSLRQETEIGGILWGKIGPGGSVVVFDATPVPSAGPRFNTTAVDARNLVQTLSGQSPQASLCLVGYFRSHIREGLSLTPQDRILIEQHIREPEAVFMLIKPFEAGACTAAFFFWHEGRLQDISDLEVPFIAIDEPPRRESPAPPCAKHDPAPASSVLREPPPRNWLPRETAAKPPSNGAIPSAPAHAPGKEPGWLLVIAVVLISILGLIAGAQAYWMWPVLHARLQPPPAKPPEAGIDLHVVRAPDGQLGLSWNQNAPDIIKARNATLSISDGRASPELSLDNAQLRSGRLMYFPKNADVQFRLELNVDNQHTVAESVWVLSPGAPARRRKRFPAVRPNQVPRASLVRAAPDSVPIPSQISMRTDANKTSLPLLGPLAPAPPPPLSSPQPVLTGAYLPPRAIEEMMPETAALGQFAQIAVQVSIDATGNVTAAHAAENGDNRNVALAGSAVTAARQWRFQPATLNGKPVPGEYTIVFAFRPPARPLGR
jgi:TonB family protein